MATKFEPWNILKNGDIVKPLDNIEPPCKKCKFWSPRVSTDSKGFYSGVVLCTADYMYKDFSCYTEQENNG